MPVHETNDGRTIPYSAPKDTSGMLREAPRGHTKMLPGNQSLCGLVSSGAISFIEASAPAAHRVMMDRIKAQGTVRGQNGGESNRVMPNRATFSSKKGGKREPGRGDEMFHNPTKTRVVVMKPNIGRSKSGKTMVLVQTRDGDQYKVPIDSLSSLD